MAGGSIFVCTDYNWGGLCDHFAFQNGVCANFPADLNDQISSVGPDAGWTCNLYVCVTVFLLLTPIRKHSERRSFVPAFLDCSLCLCRNRDVDCKPGQGIYTAKAPGFSKLTYGNDAFSSVMCLPS